MSQNNRWPPAAVAGQCGGVSVSRGRRFVATGSDSARSSGAADGSGAHRIGFANSDAPLKFGTVF